MCQGDVDVCHGIKKKAANWSKAIGKKRGAEEKPKPCCPIDRIKNNYFESLKLS